MFALGIKEFGYCCHVKEQSAIVDYCNVLGVKKPALAGIGHDVNIVTTLWQRNSGGVKINPGIDSRQEVAEASDPPTL
jgi:hypothetical protein